MEAATLDHKCPSCQAVLKFNPHGQNWKCEYCRGEYSLEDLKKYEKEELTTETQKAKVEKDDKGMDIYSCPNCGAQIIADENTTATSCVYCKNTAILKNKLVGEFNPTHIIPFKHTKEDAIKAFKSIGKGRPFAPREFSSDKNINEMSGIYIPFWLYDSETDGVVECNAKKIASWMSGDYQVTKTDEYLAIREGNVSYSRIPVDGSVRFDDKIMNSIEPFDYKDLIPFSHSYLSGFLAEKYDVLSDDAMKIAIERAKVSTSEIFKNDIIGYTTVSVTRSDVKFNLLAQEYALLPVWMLNIKYKEKIYTFAMNGQTGKMIGNIPIDVKKAIIWWIGIFVITFAIISLISLI